MRRFLLILFIIALALPCYGQQQIARMNPYVAGVVVAVAAETTYFGYNADGTDSGQLNGYVVCNFDTNLQFTCPGSGSKNLVSLEARVSTGTAGNIRVAIYDASYTTLIAQGSAQVAAGALGWYGHTAFTDAGGTPVSGTGLLTGGTDYTLCVTGDGSVNHQFDVVSDSALYSGNDYTEGYPETPAEPSGSARKLSIRAGVQ